MPALLKRQTKRFRVPCPAWHQPAARGQVRLFLAEQVLEWIGAICTTTGGRKNAGGNDNEADIPKELKISEVLLSFLKFNVIIFIVQKIALHIMHI